MATTPSSQRPRPFWAAWLIAVAVMISGVARAQGALDEPLGAAPEDAKLSREDKDRKARALFEQGRQAYAEGDYRSAWDYFRKAYLLSKRPQLLYNIGQSADRLRMDREALAAFKLYLERLPAADNRKEVENRVRALEQRVQREQTEQGEGDDDPAYALVDRDGKEPPSFFDASGEDDSVEPNVAPRPPGAQPRRENWYFAGALGFGLLRDSIGNLGRDTTMGSFTFAGQLAVGHQLFEPGLVLGGALMFEWGLAPSVTQNDFSTAVDTANLTMFGPFVDYYLDPQKNGWHLFGALALSWFALTDRSATFGIQDARGGALVLGGGYEWPFGEEWGLGVLGRLTLSKADQDTGKHHIGVLSVLCQGTWF
jgi:tetratricopeptide (TPR) repeat protein